MPGGEMFSMPSRALGDSDVEGTGLLDGGIALSRDKAVAAEVAGVLTPFQTEDAPFGTDADDEAVVICFENLYSPTGQNRDYIFA